MFFLRFPRSLSTRKNSAGFALFYLLLFYAVPSASETIIYPKAGEGFIDHHAYPLKLLDLALSKSGVDAQLVPSETFMTQARSLKELNKPDGIDVLWTMTSKERENDVLAIRIPIYKGLIGWRLFLTGLTPHYDSSQPITLEDLKRLNLIQGHDWPDTNVLLSNGFNVKTSTSFSGLFQMLALERADLFPRSVIEVWDELNGDLGAQLALEHHTIISYPAASYFFTARSNQGLARLIQKGLDIAIQDGSFDELFYRYFEEVISRARISERTLYRLDNPLLSSETPLGNKSLWFYPK